MAWDVTEACAEGVIEDRERAVVRVIPPRKKVAIVGFASNTMHLVPWQDPEWELWGLNQGAMNFQRRADRWFEMHQPEFTEDVRDPQYLKWLYEAVGCPVYMVETRKDVPTSVRYPIEAAIKLTGRDYFTSSIAYMIALAILEGFQEIAIYGVNLAIGGEYFHQKPNAEWWIGIAEGRGIKVYVPQAASLLKQHARYGYSLEPEPDLLTKLLLTNRITTYRTRCEELIRDYHVQLGAMREDEALLQVIEGKEHGAAIIALAPRST
jgi:hypothetical protein